MSQRDDAPPQVRVKICGITNLADAENCVALGAHLLGFNFYRRSQRYVEPEAARRIAEDLPESVKRIGVFVNAEPEYVLATVAAAHLDGVQLHGDESADYFRALQAALPSSSIMIKALRVKSDFQPADVQLFAPGAVLLDAWESDSYGGTGRTCDWGLAQAARQYVSQLYLAGGLTPENVEEAVRTVRPDAVDVCSGVESTPGRKCYERLERFIAGVRRASES